MAIDVLELAEFYASPMGLITRRMLRRRIRGLWPNLKGLDLLGVGYATPFLGLFRDEARRTVALMPARQGVMRWPKSEPALVALAEETELPLADASFGRILMVHALEHSEEVRPSLREIWRVLAPEGRLLLVVPHRRGAWAASERTPFGHGHPYSRGQIERLLGDCLFEPEKPHGALYFPPLRSRLILRGPASWEAVGARLWPGLSGVILIEATKRIYAKTELGARRRALAGVPVRLAVPAGLRRGVKDEKSPLFQTDWQSRFAR